MVKPKEFDVFVISWLILINVSVDLIFSSQLDLKLRGDILLCVLSAAAASHKT